MSKIGFTSLSSKRSTFSALSPVLSWFTNTQDREKIKMPNIVWINIVKKAPNEGTAQ